MSTRAVVMYVIDNEHADAIYVHSDGYPTWLGSVLYNHYNNMERARDLVSLGYCSCVYPLLEAPAGNNHSFDKPCDNVTVAYHRDRGENLEIDHVKVGGTRFATFKEAMQYLMERYDASWGYIYFDKWYCVYADKEAMALNSKNIEEIEKKYL